MTKIKLNQISVEDNYYLNIVVNGINYYIDSTSTCTSYDHWASYFLQYQKDISVLYYDRK